MEKKYIIKDALGECVLKKDEYGSYSKIYIRSLNLDRDGILFFDSKEAAEKYIIEKEINHSTILEVFI